jgi:hypothetical protein
MKIIYLFIYLFTYLFVYLQSMKIKMSQGPGSQKSSKVHRKHMKTRALRVEHILLFLVCTCKNGASYFLSRDADAIDNT